MRPIENGGVMISLPSQQDQSCAIAKLREKSHVIGYMAEIVKKKLPRMIVHNLPADLAQAEESVVNLIKKHNPELVERTSNEEAIRLIAVHNTKFDTVKNIILEVTPLIRNQILSRKKNKLGMCLYQVHDHIHVLRCTHCNRYGHPERLCKSTHPSCGICAEDHKTINCPNQISSQNNSSSKKLCVNCSSAEHGAEETRKCPAFQARKLRLKTSINYE